jgi:hypothetical protein
MSLRLVEKHWAEAAQNTESIPGLSARQGLGDRLVDGPIITAAAMLTPAVSPLSTELSTNPFHTQPPFPQNSFNFKYGSNIFATTCFSLQDALTKHLVPGLTSGIPSSTYSQHVFNMAGDVKRRPRNLSHSSSEREPSSEPKNTRKSNSIDLVDGNTRTTTSPNPRKRPSTEPLDYPRRRAIIAVRHHFKLKFY